MSQVIFKFLSSGKGKEKKDSIEGPLLERATGEAVSLRESHISVRVRGWWNVQNRSWVEVGNIGDSDDSGLCVIESTGFQKLGMDIE